MELELSKNITNDTKDEKINDFMKELQEKLNDPKIQKEQEMANRKCIDEENFATELANELNLSNKDIELLRNKIDGYLKEYSKCCGVITYEGYDINTGQYYEDWYKDGKCSRNELTEQEFALSYTMGWFYRQIPQDKNPTQYYSGYYFEEIKDAIKFSIEEQLEDGVKFKDINLFKLKNEIKNNEYLKPLYDEYN